HLQACAGHDDTAVREDDGARSEDAEGLPRHRRGHGRSGQEDQQGCRLALSQPLFPEHVHRAHVRAGGTAGCQGGRAMNHTMKSVAVALASVALRTAALAQTLSANYPADYAQLVAAAKKEGKVVIYSALDTKAAQPLIKDFNAVYPDIKVEYNDMNSTEMYNRYIAE